MSQARAQQAEARLVYFGEERFVFDQDARVGLAAGAGLEPDAARQALQDGSYGGEVRADEDEARRLGIGGVPFCVLAGMYAVSGAQPAETFAEALAQAWDSQSGR